MYIGKSLVSEDEYHLNAVRDSGYRHRYAVALLWDLLNLREGSVRLPLLSGRVSEDVMDGIDKVIQPDELQSLSGFIPDFALLRDSRPIRALVVVVEAAPPQEEIDRVNALGVEIVLIPVRSEDEMCLLFESFVDGRVDWATRYGPDDVPPSQGILAKRPPNPVDDQAKSDKWMADFMGHLRGCSPSVRRQFVSMLMVVGRLDSLYPVRDDNPSAPALGGFSFSGYGPDDDDNEAVY